MVDVVLDIEAFIDSLRSRAHPRPGRRLRHRHRSRRRAVEAIRAGAKEYVPLPPDAELIAAVLEAVAEENNAIIHSDPALASVLKLADQIAPSDASVLITGESGTGKEVMARYIHSKSKRAEQPFISVNCAAIPENLLESELFGHEKGAFTGAVARRIGKFEEADGGTLLLDEISEMDPRLQAKLLRAIQEREIDRVGGTKPVKVDIRILATSNRDLAEEVRRGTFREDLFYRLNVVNLRLPPLRERPGDIKRLAAHFLAQILPRPTASADAVRRRGADQAARPWLARQRARAREHDPPRGAARARRRDRRRRHHADGRRWATATPPAAPRPSGAAAGGDTAGSLVGRTVADVERD